MTSANTQVLLHQKMFTGRGMLMVQNDNRKVQYYKRMYLQGTRMLLVHMNEEPWPIPDNTEGTVVSGGDTW